MARITQLTAMKRENHKVHEVAECGYTIFQGTDGAWYIQIDTFGSPSRKLKGKVSQSLQFGAKAANELRDLINKTFPID